MNYVINTDNICFFAVVESLVGKLLTIPPGADSEMPEILEYLVF